MKKEYQVTVGEEQFMLSGEERLDAVPTSAGKLHVLLENKAYEVELLEQDFQAKRYRLKVNGKLHTVDIATPLDQLVDKMGLTIADTQKVSDIKAPMPGLVLSVAVEAGQTIQEGDALLVLEAMKMENLIKAPGDGVVKSVEISKGMTVEKGQLLISLD